MKQTIKRMLSLLLVTALLMSCSYMPHCISVNAAQQQYITELVLSHVPYRDPEHYDEDAAKTTNQLSSNGYNIVNHDLNAGIFGDFIYIGYKTGTAVKSAIRDIKIYIGSNPPSTMTESINGKYCTYYPILDLNGYYYNLNANGDYGALSIYGYYTRDASAGNPIVSISVSEANTSSNVTYFGSTEPANLNYGATHGVLNFPIGKIFMTYTTATPPIQSDPVFPAGYDRNNDKYSFKNPSEKVSANIYSIVYGPIKGGYLALADSFGGPGLCYGMATTTAALLQNRNTINSFISSYANVAISEIAGLLPEYKSTELNMDLLTFMKYGHVAQYASDREANNGNLRGLYSAIKSYVNGTGFPVIISVWQKDSVLFRKNGHAILATGIRETDDAYMLQIDDSNFAYLTPELSISKDFSTWSYSVDGKKFSDGSSYSYSSANGIINYDTEGNTVYHLGKIAGQLSPSDYLKYNSILVVSSSEIIQNNNLTQVFTTSESDSGPEQSYNVYWADEDLHSIQLSTEYNENELTVADTYSSISIILDENETAEFYISDEDENSVAYYSDKNNNASITFATSNEQGENVITTISGTTNGGEVSASENAEGVNVSGLNDIFISVETKQGTASTSAKTTNGDAVNIIFNADKNTVKTDWQCQHIDVDQNYNCDICGAPVATPPAPETPDTPADDDNSCSCICHSENSIVQFFYTIFRFLWQLFGMNMDCACGVKHFDFYIFA